MSENIIASDHLKTSAFVRFQTSGWQVNGKTFSWTPPTDVFETATKLIIKIEIAGMKHSDIDINFEDNYLIVSGLRSESSERRAYHQMEVRFGEFQTMVALPKGLNLESAEAEYEDGFLLISIPFSNATNIRIEG